MMFSAKLFDALGKACLIGYLVPLLHKIKHMEMKDNYDGVLQQRLQSGFGARSTAREVINHIDLSGKTAIVTGGYAGIGLETAMGLASAGANVIVPARSREKANRNLSGVSGVSLAHMDLMDRQSI